ncbi:hypothetical protein B0T10DRAFT_471753 [Thelonectria olida]|uniref:Zn(2)-C6 fungal-type domain-containing protein n=1 Tax=Thelonectria olida TaxID=1576542 RepID=A0A9P8WFV9_9HYPO|nr:hypothetical protein B0T10DRAFT_471753 [Thelonectria olida]
MVGVAGRSKACHTCKERKIKCGGEKPDCANCVKSGRLCAGYRRKQAFIISQYTNTSITQSGQGKLQSAYESGAAPVLLSRWRRDESARPLSSSPYTPGTRLSQHRGPSHSNMPSSISLRNVSRDQFLAFYIDDQCPSSSLRQAHLSKHRKWLLHLASISSLSPALEHAILAVSTAKFGQKCQYEALASQSLPLYTRGLRELQRAINNPISRCDSQTITACVMLGMYEFSECPGRTVGGYMKHYQGAMTLLQLRGPGQHVNGLAHDMFQVLRMHTVYQGLRQRQATILVQPEWMEEPYASKPKSSHDVLLDIFLQIPSILARMDTLLSIPRHQDVVIGISDLLTSCLALDEKLKSWFLAYQSATGSLYWPELSTTPSITDHPELGKTFPVSFHFPSYAVAESIVLYWTVQVLLHAQICGLRFKLFKRSQGAAETAEGVLLGTATGPSGHQAEWPQTSARYVCQSVEYFLGNKFQNIGPGSILPPLIVVRTCLSALPKDWTRETSWINEMIGRIQNMGANLAEHTNI